jgi:uncharacterized membrane protein YtjA (UPF0391 family)
VHRASVLSYAGWRRFLAAALTARSYSEGIATEVVANPLSGRTTDPSPEPFMLHYAVVFFVIALIAAVLGFGGIAASAAGIAKLLFVVFLVMALVSIVVGLIRKR